MCTNKNCKFVHIKGTARKVKENLDLYHEKHGPNARTNISRTNMPPSRSGDSGRLTDPFLRLEEMIKGLRVDYEREFSVFRAELHQQRNFIPYAPHQCSQSPHAYQNAQYPQASMYHQNVDSNPWMNTSQRKSWNPGHQTQAKIPCHVKKIQERTALMGSTHPSCC